MTDDHLELAISETFITHYEGVRTKVFPCLGWCFAPIFQAPDGAWT